MTVEEYVLRVKSIQTHARSQIRAAEKELALSNNPYKIGDLVTDHIGTICIETVSVNHFGQKSNCKYTGPEYTQQGVPRRDNRKREVYQQNIIQETP